jgi:hypothetical protein
MNRFIQLNQRINSSLRKGDVAKAVHHMVNFLYREKIEKEGCLHCDTVNAFREALEKSLPRPQCEMEGCNNPARQALGNGNANYFTTYCSDCESIIERGSKR